MDKPFQVKIGSGSYIQVVAGSGAATVVAAANEAYDLDGSGTAVNDAAGSAVVEAVIPGVTGGDALALSTLLDGPTLSGADATLIDLAGRVKYAAPVGGLTTVYVYITHR